MSRSTQVILSRRQCLQAVAGSVLWPSAWAAATNTSTTLVAAWEAENQYRVGLILVEGDR